jgi:hypothetical protein
MKTDKKAEAESFLGNKVEQVLADLRRGRTLEAGERSMKGAADMSVNSPERVANYM